MSFYLNFCFFLPGFLGGLRRLHQNAVFAAFYRGLIGRGETFYGLATSLRLQHPWVCPDPNKTGCRKFDSKQLDGFTKKLAVNWILTIGMYPQNDAQFLKMHRNLTKRNLEDTYMRLSVGRLTSNLNCQGLNAQAPWLKSRHDKK